MNRSLRQPAFLVMLCLGMLFVRGGGVHLHLCLDGQEAPASVHWGDSGVHEDAAHADQSHEDRDLSLSQAIAKTFKGFSDQPLAAIAFLVLVFLLRVEGIRLLPMQVRQALAAPAFLRPPLRGPPV